MSRNSIMSLMDQFLEDSIRPVTYHIGRGVSYTPATNIKEFSDHYQIKMSVPEIDPEKVKIEVVEKNLSISYDSQKNDEDAGEYLRQEYIEYYSFSRTFNLPKNVVEDTVEAKYKKGILTVTINKAPQAQPRKVNVVVDND